MRILYLLLELCSGPKKKKNTSEIIKKVCQVQLWFLYNALLFNVLGHYVKLQDNPFCTLGEMLRSRKTDKENNLNNKPDRVMLIVHCSSP